MFHVTSRVSLSHVKSGLRACPNGTFLFKHVEKRVLGDGETMQFASCENKGLILIRNQGCVAFYFVVSKKNHIFQVFQLYISYNMEYLF